MAKKMKSIVAKKEHIFYSVEEKGKGIWGIRPEYRKSSDDEIPLEVLQKKEALLQARAAVISDEQCK